ELVFRKLYAQLHTTAEKKAFLAKKVEDDLDMVCTRMQWAFFEKKFYETRREGDLTAEEAGDLWMEELKERAGPSYRAAKGQQHSWTRVPHFFNDPFYAYTYPVGALISKRLFQVYDEGKISDFKPRYAEALKAGLTKTPEELLQPF